MVVSCVDVANPERFECLDVAADAESASRIREEFADWLDQFFDLDPIKSSDLVLAINEALANVAEYAYLTIDRPETMHVLARYHVGDANLTVRVSDNGRWYVAGEASAGRFRGNGIPLMRALSDRVTIDTSTNGTQVCLQWDGVAAA
jgi:serine/threonine-protein kinase RsbW